MPRHQPHREPHTDDSPEGPARRDRREFIRRIGVGLVATSTYSVLTLSQLGCGDSDDPMGPGDGSYY
jgi:hypothetical protein